MVGVRSVNCSLGARVPFEVHCCEMAAPGISLTCQLEPPISFETPAFVIIRGKKKVSSHMNSWLTQRRGEPSRLFSSASAFFPNYIVPVVTTQFYLPGLPEA